MLRPPPPLFPEFRLRLSPFLIGLLLAVLGVVHGRAQTTLYWDTNGSTSGAGATPSATWSNSNTDKNWSTGFFGNSSTVQWTAGSNAFFSAGFDASSAFTVTVSGTISVAGMTVLMGDPTFTGGTLNFSDASPDIAIIVGSNTTINSTIAGSNGLNKSNTGTLVLGGSNTYTGTTSISAGVVNLRSATALGSTTGGTTVASGAALEVQNNLTVSGEALTLNGTGVSGNGALRNISGTNTWTGAVSLGSAARIQSDAGTLTISGAVTGGGNALTVGGAGSTTLSGAVNLGSGTFTKDGAGSVTLSGSTANTSTGAVAVNDGTLNLAKSSNTNAVGTGAVTVGDGTGAASSANLVLQASRQLATTTAVTLNADGRLGVNNFTEKIDTIAGTGLIDLATSGFLTIGANNGSSTFAGSITGTGTLEKAGTGTLTFGSTISFGGTLQLLGGTLALNGTSLTVDTLHITGNTVIDFGSSAASILNATTVIVDAGVTLTVVNWTNAVDFLYATNNPGATQLARVAFTGYSASSTAWLPFDHQITPAPEPRLYGALLTAATLGATGWIRRRRAAA